MQSETPLRTSIYPISRPCLIHYTSNRGHRFDARLTQDQQACSRNSLKYALTKITEAYRLDPTGALEKMQAMTYDETKLVQNADIISWSMELVQYAKSCRLTTAEQQAGQIHNSLAPDLRELGDKPKDGG